MISRTVILAPHHDDVALFSAFNAIRHRAHIVVVFRSVKQERYGITNVTRQVEETRAAQELGCTVEFWDFSDTDPDWEHIAQRIYEIDSDHVYAPAPEDQGGNEQHDRIGNLALSEGRQELLSLYLTYTTEGKSTWGHRVEFEPAWVPMKLRALACHVSQASLPNCLPHFLREQFEFVA